MKPMSEEAQEALDKLTPESRAKVIAAVKKATAQMLDKMKNDPTPQRHQG